MEVATGVAAEATLVVTIAAAVLVPAIFRKSRLLARKVFDMPFSSYPFS
jgi:hypothetical protein